MNSWQNRKINIAGRQISPLWLAFWLIEIPCSWSFISSFGFLLFILEIIATGIAGAYILMRFGMNQLAGGMFGMVFGGGDLRQMALFFGSLLLMIPGIFTDILGICALGYWFWQRQNTQNFTQNNKYNNTKNDDIIDVEVIE